MPLRSVVCGTVTLVAFCLLPPAGQPVSANTEPSRNPHQKPAAIAAAVELPVFQAGLWQYRQTVVKDDSPIRQISMLRKCADPSTEIRTRMAQLESRSCQFAPLAHQHNRYMARWTCPTPQGPMSFRAVLIAKGATGYEYLNEVRTAQGVTRHRIVAARVGECPDRGGPPMNPNLKAMPRT